ncbi:ATP-binding protein [Erysipelothrix rhusiopathiae]|nr:ATP-binding protein [Erysipelothrix rhusiopathiae]
MKTLSYTVEDEIIAEILGRQNFTTKESAILELVKNSYDANASSVKINVYRTSSGVELLIEDDGEGMDEQTILKNWMHVGKSEKKYSNNGRVLAGSKGIGRFALSRLSNKATVNSTKKNSDTIYWNTTWAHTEYKTIDKVSKTGTSIVLSDLRDKWSRRSIKPLCDYLSRVYYSTEMKIFVGFEDDYEIVNSIWENPVFGETHSVSVDFKYDSNRQTVQYRLLNKEFSEENNVALLDFKGIEEIIGEKEVYPEIKKMFDEQEFKDFLEEELTDKEEEEEIREYLRKLGSFHGLLYFGISRNTKKDKEYFMYNYTSLDRKYETQMILYRNAFGIDSYDGRDDWLEIRERARKSPAAATHPTGKWRVRVNQLSGYIAIDKKNNSEIKDVSNRQGIIENIYFGLLREIVGIVIGEFERNRQSIIRNIDNYRKEQIKTKIKKESENSKKSDILMGNIKKNPLKMKEFGEEEARIVLDEYFNKEFEKEYYRKEKETIESDSRYEVQLLNVLATSHLKALSLSHQISNNRSNISSTTKGIRDGLEKVGYWEELTRIRMAPHLDVVLLLEKMDKYSQNFLRLADTIISETEKNKFKVFNQSFEKLIEEIVEKWENQYSWIKIKTEYLGDTMGIISYDQFMVIFDNLILNSIQHNQEKNILEIKIILQRSDANVFIHYEDDGIGLSQKYIEKPFNILEVHESDRSDGHGLGMWIVNNTVKKMEGEITDISSISGFSLDAYIKIQGETNAK